MGGGGGGGWTAGVVFGWKKKSVNGKIRKKKPLTHRDKKNNIIAAYKS